MKRNDVLLVGILLGIAALFFVGMLLFRKAGAEVVIYKEGIRTEAYPLTGELELELVSANGSNHLVIRDGEAYLANADCPDRLCVHMGAIKYDGQTIVCLPHKLVVAIEGGEKETDKGTGESVDVVVRCGEAAPDTKISHNDQVMFTGFVVELWERLYWLGDNICQIEKIRRTVMDILKVLVVDDESRMRKLVRDFLEREGYRVLEAENGEKAVDIFFDEKDIALVILDVMMPKMDGWQVLKEIRQFSKVPIIMLTARADERDELLGFDLGVDEYIAKPFSPKILVARVNAVLRRSGKGEKAEVLDKGGIRIDKSAHQVTIDGRPIDLSFKEFELLTYFVENAGIALSREKILNAVWNYDYFGDARTIDTHVKKLRAKMGEKGETIKTIWGMGYKFEV